MGVTAFEIAERVLKVVLPVGTLQKPLQCDQEPKRAERREHLEDGQSAPPSLFRAGNGSSVARWESSGGPAREVSAGGLHT